MSFLKSYYSSVSSFLTGDEESENTEAVESIAEENTLKESKSEGWLKGIYNGAYNQSGELWKAVKTDLTEFATVISKDAKVVVVKTAIGVKNGLVGSEEITNEDIVESTETNKSSAYKIRSSINKMFDKVSKALYIPPESDEDEYYYENENGSQTHCNRTDARISNLQKNRKTFETDPSSSEIDPDLGDFVQWKENLKIDDFQSTISELVKTNQFIFDYYADLVPRSLTHDEFWSRYFYRVASINSEESRREALKLRISHDEKIVNDTDPCDWDDGNDIYEESNLSKKEDCVKPIVVDNLLIKNADKLSFTEDKVLSDTSLKFKEKDDVIVVKHSVDSSSASEDNSPEIYHSIDQKGVEEDTGWDDEIDVDVNDDDIELARNTSEADVLEAKWDDWS